MEPKIKIGLILTLVGMILWGIGNYLFRFFIFGYHYWMFFSFLSFLPFIFILAGLIILYNGLPQRGRGILLNIVGIGLLGLSAFLIFSTVRWMDSIVALIIVFTLFWLFLFNIPGLYKIIKQEDLPDYIVGPDLWASCTMFCIIIYTLIIAAIGQRNFIELFYKTYNIWLFFCVALGAAISGILYAVYLSEK